MRTWDIGTIFLFCFPFFLLHSPFSLHFKKIFLNFFPPNFFLLPSLFSFFSFFFVFRFHLFSFPSSFLFVLICQSLSRGSSDVFFLLPVRSPAAQTISLSQLNPTPASCHSHIRLFPAQRGAASTLRSTSGRTAPPGRVTAAERLGAALPRGSAATGNGTVPKRGRTRKDVGAADQTSSPAE